MKDTKRLGCPRREEKKIKIKINGNKNCDQEIDNSIGKHRPWQTEPAAHLQDKQRWEVVKDAQRERCQLVVVEISRQ